jgi:hypothetical protein
VPITLNRPSFAAGELDPMFHGRVDMDKYHVGCRTVENMVVHPHGGASKRQGTALVGLLPGDGRVIPFQFNAEQTYALVFTAGLLQVVMDGAFIANAVDIVDADRWVWTSTTRSGVTWYYLRALGESAPALPDMVNGPSAVYLNGTAVADADWDFGDYDTLGYSTIYLKTATDPDTLAFGAYVAEFSGNLQIDSPFAAADLRDVSYCQSADTVFFAHPSYPPCKLLRYSHYTWRFVTMAFEPEQQSPGSVTATYSKSPGETTRAIRYAVSAISTGGEESEMSEDVSVTIDSPWASGATVAVAWAAAPGARQYNVWKNSRGSWGLVATTDTFAEVRKQAGTTISGGDYSATYAKTKAFDGSLSTYWLSDQVGAAVDGAAYIGLNLGSAKAVTRVRLRQKSGYGLTSAKLQTSPDGTTWSDLVTLALDQDANDWEVFDVNDAAATAQYWRLLADSDAQNSNRWGVIECELMGPYGGLSFTDDNVNEDTDEGPITIERPFSEAGDYPCCVALYQQRLWYGGTDNQPTTIWASRSGILENFSVSTPLRDDDAIEATLASRQADRIRHMIPLRDLAILTAGSEWRLVPGENGAITPTALQLSPQGYFGAAPLRPLAVNGSVLFLTRTGTEVRDLAYAFASDGYEGSNLTVLSGHLFRHQTTPGLRDWDFAKYPDSIVWAVREAGDLLGFTYLKEHDVWAWHRHELGAQTGGTAAVRSLCVLPDDGDDGSDSIYLVVARTVGDTTTYMLEAMLPENAEHVYLDGAVEIDDSTGATEITFGITGPDVSDFEDSWTFTAGGTTDGAAATVPDGLALSLLVEQEVAGVWEEAPVGTVLDHATGLAPDLTAGWADGEWTATLDVAMGSTVSAVRLSIVLDEVVLSTYTIPVGDGAALVLPGIIERQTAVGRTVWESAAEPTLEEAIAEVNALAPSFADPSYDGTGSPTNYESTHASAASNWQELYVLLCDLQTQELQHGAGTPGWSYVAGETNAPTTRGKVGTGFAFALEEEVAASIAAVRSAAEATWGYGGSFGFCGAFLEDVVISYLDGGEPEYLVYAFMAAATASASVRVPALAVAHSARMYCATATPPYGFIVGIEPVDPSTSEFHKLGYDVADSGVKTKLWDSAAGTWTAVATGQFPDADLPMPAPWPATNAAVHGHLRGWYYDLDNAVVLVDWTFAAQTATASVEVTLKVQPASPTLLASDAVMTAVHADGTVERDVLVTGGVAYLAYDAAPWTVLGYEYTGTLETLPLELPADMTAQGKRKRVTAVSLRLYETREAYWGPDATTQDGPITGTPLWRTADPGDWTDHRMPFPAGWATPGRVCLTFPNPYPATVLEIMPEVLVGG